ncbi:CDP-alcohol phosphatidyltransferase [Marivirga tractuosa]|uniref:CDP-alcohol phosphatidyltransferase n=1 Tax=Marivirga tractuosa (strain ATCC 23168 / DSM 4126 / NBRC 15989 / NCIMB 1408 / VKM B-1430 / H-43) TaxID=643867 RepID=E4TPA7_MARTH|nr:CDP-alcohol phosphatidyltransferase family protein [Marivirga tractuosa]ADR20510.1 CDP-alcohol phosphatidyltransferase [Marivirga tractuosa DSM 4126]BDD15044.1 CDP-alcohol phosphatidyltransferase [Marivirga tractuosa]
MPKINKQQKFFDFSDYGRSPAIYISNLIKNTSITPIHVTIAFGIIGLISAYAILEEHYIIAGMGLILKSIVDAMDGELARIKESPSYSGRYLDSIFDSVLNLIILLTIAFKSSSPLWLGIIAYFCIQLQGTLYNYYYVILRHRSIGGDTTSKIFEMKPPIAFSLESQTTVNILFRIFQVLYLPFDWLIYQFDKDAFKIRQLPNWFMSMISIYGLGFQLMLMAVMMPIGLIDYIIPFFICYSTLVLVFITVRKLFIS